MSYRLLQLFGNAAFVRAMPAAAATVLVASATASQTFVGTGTNPESANAAASGQAIFSISGNVLTVTLTNTTSGGTVGQGNSLTGVSFDLLSGSAPLTLASISLAPGSQIWTSKTASNTVDALAGSWTSALGATPIGQYGAATSGFNGAFNGGSITLGNSSPDYGIVSAGTFTGSAGVPFSGSKFPFIQDTLVLTFNGASGVSEQSIGNVKFLFGTDGTGVVTGGLVPAPGAMALLALAGLGASRRRRAA